MIRQRAAGGSVWTDRCVQQGLVLQTLFFLFIFTQSQLFMHRECDEEGAADTKKRAKKEKSVS